MRSFLSSALFALLWSVPALATAGVIHGTLRVPFPTTPQAAGANAYPGSAGSMPCGHEPQRGLASDAVIYVDHVPASTESVLAASTDETPQLAQKGQMFVPRVVAIAESAAEPTGLHNRQRLRSPCAGCDSFADVPVSCPMVRSA